MSLPATLICPESALRMPAMRLRSVVLPEPEPPTSAICSPGLSENEGILTTVCVEPSGVANCFFKLCISSTGMVIGFLVYRNS